MLKKQGILRRTLSIVLCLLLVMGGAAGSQFLFPEQASALAGFPNYEYLDTVEPANLSYNRTGEFIFPCVIKATDHISNPLGTYYLYYAPHDAPGGICLAYSNNIEGPYTEYSGNPIVAKDWPDKYSVSHVSSPYVMWMPQYDKYFMYFHGENHTNRWAYSTDGVNWSYGGVCLTASQFGSGYTECQYAKVFEYTIPGQNNRYIMLSMLLYGTGNGRRIALSVSNDGKTFTPYDNALISPAADNELNISGPTLYRFNGGYYVVYHGSTGNMYITDVGSDFSRENHMGVYHAPMQFAPDSGRSASPFFYTDSATGTRYLFYEAGARLDATIALAKESTSVTFECESLATTASGASQEDAGDAKCSAAAFNKFNADGVNDYVQYEVNVPSAGKWNIFLVSKRQNSRGKYKLYLPQAGEYVGSERDQYSSSDQYIITRIGSYDFNSGGVKQFRFVITGKNGSSSGYALGNDAIILTK